MVVVNADPSSAATTLNVRVEPMAGSGATAALSGDVRPRAAIASARARGATVRSIRRRVASNLRAAGLSAGTRSGDDAAADARPTVCAVAISQSTASVGSPTLANCPTTR